MMEQHQELLQREIDGLNNAAESAKLESLLAKDAGLRQTFDELTAVRVAFNSLTEKTPSPRLRASIMNALPIAPQPVIVHERISFWQTVQGLILNPRPVSLAYAFSIGILVSFVAWNIAVVPGGSPVEEGLTGTITRTKSPVIYDSNISPEADLGSVYVTSRNGQIRIEVRWNGTPGAKTIVRYDPSEAYATGVESVMRESSLTTITRSQNFLEYTTVGPSIDITTLVLLDGQSITENVDNSATTLTVEILSDGMTPAVHRIPVSALN